MALMTTGRSFAPRRVPSPSNALASQQASRSQSSQSRKSSLLAGWVFAAIVLPAALLAQTPAVTTSSTESGASWTLSTDVVFGFEFTPNSDLDVTHLGLWDYQVDGIVATYPMGLFDAAGNALGTTQIDAGTGNELRDGFRFVALANPARIQAGQSYRVACYQAADQEKERFLSTAQTGTQLSFNGVFSVAGRFQQFGTNGLIAPTSLTTGGFLIGPNFLFREPGQPAVTTTSTMANVSWSPSADVVFGFEFTPNSSFDVTHLGLWDDADEGMIATYPMGLFDAAGNALGTTQIDAGTGNELRDGFRYAPLATPVTVQAGQSYRVACYQAIGQAKERFLRSGVLDNQASFSNAFALEGSFEQFGNGGLIAPTSPTISGWRVGPTFLMNVEGVEVSRVGTPANPDVFLPGVSGPPRLGSAWEPVVDHTTFLPSATMDFAVIGLAPANVPFVLGTLLCDLPNPVPTISTLAGSPFSLPIPSDDGLVGVTLCVQALSFDGTDAALTNALDIKLGV